MLMCTLYILNEHLDFGFFWPNLNINQLLFSEDFVWNHLPVYYTDPNEVVPYLL